MTILIRTYILRAYHSFVHYLFPAILEYNEVMKIENTDTQELVERKDLDFYDKEALRHLGGLIIPMINSSTNNSDISI